MSSVAKIHPGSDQLHIAALRQAWIQAVLEGDANRLTTLVTDDIVVVRANGQYAFGKEEFKTGFERFFKTIEVQRTVFSPQLVFRGHWAIEIDEVESTRTSVGKDEKPYESHFNAVFVFRKQADDSWKVARVLELLD